MPRLILDEAHIHPAVRNTVSQQHRDVVETVRSAITAHAVVVVGMRANPFPRKARALLDAAGIPYHYLEFGSYFSQWRPRTALKMWSGWSTFPLIFVKGVLVGGYTDLKTLHASGELVRLLGR